MADPKEYPNLFPDLELGLEAEIVAREQAKHPIPAVNFAQVEGSNEVDVIQEIKQNEQPDENGNLPHGLFKSLVFR